MSCSAGSPDWDHASASRRTRVAAATVDVIEAMPSDRLGSKRRRPETRSRRQLGTITASTSSSRLDRCGAQAGCVERRQSVPISSTRSPPANPPPPRHACAGSPSPCADQRRPLDHDALPGRIAGRGWRTARPRRALDQRYRRPPAASKATTSVPPACGQPAPRLPRTERRDQARLRRPAPRRLAITTIRSCSPVGLGEALGRHAAPVGPAQAPHQYDGAPPCAPASSP